MKFVHSQVPEESAEAAARAWEKLMRDPRSKQHAPDVLAQEMRKLFNSGKPVKPDAIEALLSGATTHLEGVQDLLKKSGIGSFSTSATKSGDTLVPPHQRIVEKPTPIRSQAHTKRSNWMFEHLSAEQKICGGMSLLLTGLSAVGAINNFRQAVGKDDTGASQIQWSHVGMGIISAALAAGTAYVAHQQLRAPSHVL